MRRRKLMNLKKKRRKNKRFRKDRKILKSMNKRVNRRNHHKLELE